MVRKVLERRQSVVAGERRRVAVLFADVRQFTSLSERLPPEEVVSILNAYLDRMTRVIGERGGRIDKFIGDAIMADWGALDDVDAPEAAAVSAALAMVRALAELNAEPGHADRKLVIGIGLNCGEVVAGSIGSSHKLEFTIIGDTVNVASRLEGLTKRYGASILASRAIVDGAGEGVLVRRLDREAMRGREDETEICEILDADDPRAARIETWERAMDHVVASRWSDALAAFEEAREGLHDPTARHLADRCRARVAEESSAPPASGAS